MVLSLGARVYDLASRALVLATDPTAAVDGADLVEVEAGDVAGAVQARGVPVAAAVDGPDDVAAACRAGAVVIVDRAGLSDLATVRAVAEAGVVVIALVDDHLDVPDLVERARAAEAAGVPPTCIILAPTLPADEGMLAAVRRLAVLGYPLVYSAGDDPSPAAIATAVTGGCRIVRTGAVRQARRVCDVLGAVLEVGR